MVTQKNSAKKSTSKAGASLSKAVSSSGKAKVTPKKAPSKRKTTSVVTRQKTLSSKVMPKDVKPSNTIVMLLGWLLAVLFGGGLLGMFLADSYWMEQFDAENSMLVVDDKTWMPIGGKPVTVMVLNDANCGVSCDTKSGLDSLRASVNPALIVEEVDVNTAEGEALIKAFDLVSVPQYFFAEDIEDFELEGPDGETLKFIDNLPAGILIKKDDLYYIDGAKVGFKPGKFITTPDFDTTNEPVLGDGPVKVVEFTDLQCPYCKRFYDQNKTLIEQLVADGSITYMMKDFPLSFHKEAMGGMHKALNCSLQEGSIESYNAVKDQIFANQASFNGMGIAGAENKIIDYASEQGVDIASCLENDGVMIQAEIQADIAEGAKYGVSGTPAVFVGTQILPGAVGPAVVEAAVKAELAK